MYQEDLILEKTKWFDTIAAVAVSIMLLIVGAIALRWFELEFSTAHAQTTEQVKTTQVQPTSIHESFYEGYIAPAHLLMQVVPTSPDFITVSEQEVQPISRSFWHTLFGIHTAQAAEVQEYQAELVAQSHEYIRLAPGKSFTVSAEYKNTGTATWSATDNNFIALNVDQPAGRISAFQHSFWNEHYYRPARLKQGPIAPGQNATLNFAIHAPNEPGTYVEHFKLVAENKAWIEGGELTLTIIVASPYEAKLANQSAKVIGMDPGRAITVWADFKNVGTTTWTNTGDHFIALNVDQPAGRTSPFTHSYWKYDYRPARLLQSSVRPGETGRVVFALQAPEEIGVYTEHFGLVAEDLTWLAGGKVAYQLRVGNPNVLEQSYNEPSIRVGISAVQDEITVAGNGAMQLMYQGEALDQVSGTEIRIRYANGVYTASYAGIAFTRPEAFQIAPVGNTILEVTSYENRPGWNPNLNDNRFRGNIELRYAEESDTLWLINELALEQYLRGIAETSNDSEAEFQKTLMIAARSYAWYHVQRNTKHADEHFTVDATYDQVYRGYGFELRSPNVSAAVDATRGQVVAYQDEAVITPYFSHSDGRTRSWEEVWGGGPKAWLVSVPDPASEGLTMNGHGVGMSARGALDMAANGKIAAEILRYFYTDTTLKNVYE